MARSGSNRVGFRNHYVAFITSGAQGVERPAGNQGETRATVVARHPGVAPIQHIELSDPVVDAHAVGALNTDRISDGYLFKKSQVGIAMPADDAVASCTRRRRALLVARPERERAAARASEHEERHALCRRFQPCHRPSIGPWPGLRRCLAGQGALPRALDQQLRELRLGIEVRALPEQRGARRGEQQGGRERQALARRHRSAASRRRRAPTRRSKRMPVAPRGSSPNTPS